MEASAEPETGSSQNARIVRMVPKMPDQTFRCPTCGSTCFGSWGDAADPRRPMQRSCHGRIGAQNCRFTWPEKDDWKYFLVDGVKLDVMEYAAFEAHMRSMTFVGFGPMRDG